MENKEENKIYWDKTTQISNIMNEAVEVLLKSVEGKNKFDVEDLKEQVNYEYDLFVDYYFDNKNNKKVIEDIVEEMNEKNWLEYRMDKHQ